jgi:hypothetical protein
MRAEPRFGQVLQAIGRLLYVIQACQVGSSPHRGQRLDVVSPPTNRARAVLHPPRPCRIQQFNSFASLCALCQEMKQPTSSTSKRCGCRRRRVQKPILQDGRARNPVSTRLYRLTRTWEDPCRSSRLKPRFDSSQELNADPRRQPNRRNIYPAPK